MDKTVFVYIAGACYDSLAKNIVKGRNRTRLYNICAVQRDLDANQTMTLMFLKVEYVLGMTWSCLLELDCFFL